MKGNKFLGETSGYGSETEIGQGKKVLLETLQKDSFGREKKVLLLLSHDYIGEDNEFGKKLLQDMLETISACESLPQTVVLMGKAVKFACAGENALGSLCRMEAMGTEILLCEQSAKEFDCSEHICCGLSVGAKTLWSVLSAADKVIAF